MVLDKTGGLFRLAVGLMRCFSAATAPADYTPLLNALAQYFQIRDDFLNIFNTEYMQSKSYCEGEPPPRCLSSDVVCLSSVV
jgi:geranylgeranyl diphosphate synthase type 3